MLSINWEVVASSAAVVQCLTIFVLIWQLHKDGQVNKAANTLHTVELNINLFLEIIKNRELREIRQKGLENMESYDKLSDIDKMIFNDMVASFLTLHDNVYHQYRKRLVDKETYDVWASILSDIMKKDVIGKIWDKQQNNFEKPFKDYVNNEVLHKHKITP